ncbi:MAG: FAD-dependent oxidoreductase [Alphaproteobacteria bacterium]|nr:FAD-dependent oxidoreductase [Alphaproteobacteria bacterium]
MKIAIIGAGISGMGAAYLLAKDHDITLYEKNKYIGGHSRTIDVASSSEPVAVDTGFIVFNNWNYPNLLGLFDALSVPYQKSDMSFGVSIQNGWLEYSSYGLFAQKRNLFRPNYWKMLANILRFNKKALAYIERDTDITLGQCLDELNMGEWFKQYYLLAMGAAIWSCPLETILEFPAQTFLRFFKNHGLLSVNNRPQWYTVKGGSRTYVAKLMGSLSSDIDVKNGAVKVSQNKDKTFTVTDSCDLKETYDLVILACHADEALTLIDKPTKDEQNILGAFRYQDNKIIVHSDESFMPKIRKCWASWIYLSETQQNKKPNVSLSYWMNNLQGLPNDKTILVPLNPDRRPADEHIIDEHMFSHPIFDIAAINAQKQIETIQGKRGLWFCGAYQRYGFHEDGLLSAVNVAKSLGSDIPWA